MGVVLQKQATGGICPYPWRRFWARWLDGLIYSMIWDLFLMLCLRINTGSGRSLGEMLLNLAAISLLMLALEPLLLQQWGTTPGKWILGISLHHREGRRLTYQEGAARTWRMLLSGMGLRIPFYEWYRCYKSYKSCAEGQSLSWDESVSFSIKENRWQRIALFGVTVLLIMAVITLGAGQAMMPKHRGDITAAQFADNFNNLAHYLEWNQGQNLQASGSWQRNNAKNGVVYISASLPKFELKEERGQLITVQFEMHGGDEWIRVDELKNQMYVAALSFVGAQRDISVLDLMSRQFLQPIKDSKLESFTVQYGDILLECQVSYEGYTMTSMGLLLPQEATESQFQLSFTMTKTIL